jgi:hypothetical protein
MDLVRLEPLVLNSILSLPSSYVLTVVFRAVLLVELPAGQSMVPRSPRRIRRLIMVWLIYGKDSVY